MSCGFINKRAFSAFAIFTVMLTAFLAGCSDSKINYNGKDISGLMPELEFNLINSDGDEVTAEDYSDKVRMMFFGFTSCPDICPTTMQTLNRAAVGLPPELKGEVLTLFVSVDPKRDTPERLDKYVRFFGENIVGLTGTESQLRELAKRYRTTFGYGEPNENSDYNVSHSSAVYIFDRQGKARLLIRPDQGSEKISQDIIALAKMDD
ncbi:SCO family protein [Marinobacter sp. 1-3A]|uniref:SCO family protein n=1 Tax=Marinobacter sp. 1-3A TaxID=2582920 RepID=UPI001904F632|nr:SCO family protein [Marinobacter sp. 1-3A]MBK1872637.1 SCO family protein [Marinobacter sp. 1-3A]